jgi:hypothetical protein
VVVVVVDVATAAAFTADGVARFFIITVTKSPPEGLSLDTVDSSDSGFLAGGAPAVASGLPQSIPI